MQKALGHFFDNIIIYTFFLLFFLVPIILSPLNYELFEYNKMMLTYGLTVIIVGAWMAKMLIEKKLRIARTPLDIPILLFLISQTISTILSIDQHVSLWGYYSRFNGGLLSTISYILLFYAFVTNFPRGKIKTLLYVTLASAILIAFYGVLEHLGIDKDLWVQDVQDRVFSTLGQPNWLAAYLVALLPITFALSLQQISHIWEEAKDMLSDRTFWKYLSVAILFYAALIFTKSRSGFIAFWVVNFIFWLILLLKLKYRHATVRILLIFNLSFIIFTFILGIPFDQLSKFTLPDLYTSFQTKIEHKQPLPKIQKPIGGSIIEVGITGSGKIREIVWKGALDIFRHYPLFGTGVETFAFSYYKFRPVEHNMTSEWDFLYNKAHNEYLNFAATTGAFGLGTYLLILGVFIFWSLFKIQPFAVDAAQDKPTTHPASAGSSLRLDNNPQPASPTGGPTAHSTQLIVLSLFSGWLSILITNFFGFSVVIMQILLFLMPAMAFIYYYGENGSLPYFLFPSTASTKTKKKTARSMPYEENQLSILQYAGIITVMGVVLYLVFTLTVMWYADTVFASGYRASQGQDFTTAYTDIKDAISLNNGEPLYFDEFSFAASEMALAFADNKNSTYSGALKNQAILASSMATSISPNNVNFWKTKTRVYYVLSQIDQKYLADAMDALKVSHQLSPTDPKITYNMGLLYDKMSQTKKGIDELVATTKLKPDYRDAYYALAFLYDKEKEEQKAREALQFILQHLNPNDADAKKKLEELK
ncbi:O-antigen ligase family protein [Patescibacteria group bacterium]|nr:O-antigen ligase family protein [Patescibacteria group bacterium]